MSNFHGNVDITYIALVGLIAMRLHVLIEITLTIQNFIADGANERFLLHMLSHVIKQLIE